MSWEVRQGDCVERMAEMPAESVQCCVTSPPYWGLRDYGEEGQLGLERTPEEFVAKMVAVFREVRRVLREDGTLWLNLGDCFATGAGKVGDHPGGGEQGASWKGRKEQHRPRGPQTQPNRMPIPGLKPKDLVGIPWMVAFALRSDGWYLRRDVIWAKPNPMPESVRDRPTSAHEYLFLLTKSPRYFYDAEAIREVDNGQDHAHRTVLSGQPSLEPSNGLAKPHGGLRSPTGRAGLGRNKRSVWEIATRPFPEAHFATFPPALVEPCILAGTPPKCCGECGAPWERQLERTSTGDWNPRAVPDPMVARSTNGLSGDDFHREYVAPRTVGWESTCDHDDDSGRAVVLDPFTGAATTGLVATQLGRDFIGLELSAEYVQLGEDRIRRWAANPAGHLRGDPQPISGQLGLEV